MKNHPENIEKSEPGQHEELLDTLADCSAHMPTSDLVSVLAAVASALEIRGVDITGIAATIDKMDENADEIEAGGES
jgi:hypothetical protein